MDRYFVLINLSCIFQVWELRVNDFLKALVKRSRAEPSSLFTSYNNAEDGKWSRRVFDWFSINFWDFIVESNPSSSPPPSSGWFLSWFCSFFKHFKREKWKKKQLIQYSTASAFDSIWMNQFRFGVGAAQNIHHPHIVGCCCFFSQRENILALSYFFSLSLSVLYLVSCTWAASYVTMRAKARDGEMVRVWKKN